MKILIVEDEPLAAAQLKKLLKEIRPDSEVVAICDTVESTVNWLKGNTSPDLAFLDIHLGDGLSFEIFKKVNFDIPVIFTTAYDHYAIQAFKVNSIDYLMKPVDKDEIIAALNKYEQQKQKISGGLNDGLIKSLISSIGINKDYKKRFIVKIGTHIKAVETDNVNYFYSFQKGTFLKSGDGKNYLLDQTLETIEQLVDPGQFFRINRKYLVSLNSITDVIAYSNSRLKLKVVNQEEDDFLVAREKVKQFKEWFEGLL